MSQLNHLSLNLYPFHPTHPTLLTYNPIFFKQIFHIFFQFFPNSLLLAQMLIFTMVEEDNYKQSNHIPIYFIKMIIFMIQKQQKQHQEQGQQQKGAEQQDGQGNQRQNQDSDQQNQQQYQKWKKVEKPQKCINLYMIDFNQCDGKKCTGRKMERFKMLKALKDRKKKFKGVVLSAYGEKPVSVQDLDICLKYGLCVIDCSWHRIQETNQFRFKNQRILPYVVAGNPVNYGKPFQLSCVQALATALCTINYVPQAEYIMSKFGWADGFWSINEQIRQYANCKNIEQLQAKSQQIQQSQNKMKQRSYDISDSSSSSQNQDQDQKQEQEEQKQNQKQQITNENKNQQTQQSVQKQMA